MRSQKSQNLDHVSRCAPLLVLSPKHGATKYTWEKRGPTKWERIYTLYDTCLLYVHCRGLYRCTVDQEVFEFEVIGMFASLLDCKLIP